MAKPADKRILRKESIPGGPCSVVAVDLDADVTEHVSPFDLMAGFASLYPPYSSVVRSFLYDVPTPAFLTSSMMRSTD